MDFFEIYQHVVIDGYLSTICMILLPIILPLLMITKHFSGKCELIDKEMIEDVRFIRYKIDQARLGKRF